ncbi:exocyst complex component EXO70B1 [Panicum miliaceum]|uniref:Exocyst subunit Exo70 family protein n=1 Tax=Panicum miliaceum TaxID=4540 RepID=A0A3L6T9F7_PANMI|nr:exocyst complex component EXO70B1 [Panicum miliaceum]
MEASAAAELEAAERVVMRWGSTAASSGGGAGDEQAMLFGGPGDRVEAERFLQAVDDIRRLAPPSAAGYACASVQVAMARLEDELRHVLAARALDLEIEALAGLSSLTLSGGGRRNSDATQAAAEEDDDGGGGGGSGRGSVSSSVGRRRTYRSLLSIREVDLYPADAISEPPRHRLLHVRGGGKVRRWIRAARTAVPRVFASERRLCFNIFRDLPLCDSAAAATATAAVATHDAPFAEAVKGAALQLFGFAEAISIGRRSPEKLFKIIDLHDALSDMLPDIFAASKAAKSIYVQAAEIRSPLADAVRGILSEFENAVLRDPSKTPVPGGTIHPLTRYVMNYSSFISDHKTTLSELIISRPSSATSRIFAEGNEAAPAFLDLDLPDPDSQLPLAAHLVWIIAVLEHNLESKALLYKDAALYHLFLMNNMHYIVHKRLTGKFRLAATSYQRIAWLKILNCLRDEGLHASGGFSSGVSKSALRERFKAFNSAFEVAHKIESAWYVPDTQLREELRISISEKLLPAYRSFLGRFRHHIENGRHPETYIKYSVEDLEIAMEDFFEGAPSSPHNRRRSHG